jgi:hypothetical protein
VSRRRRANGPVSRSDPASNAGAAERRRSATTQQRVDSETRDCTPRAMDAPSPFTPRERRWTCPRRCEHGCAVSRRAIERNAERALSVARCPSDARCVLSQRTEVSRRGHLSLREGGSSSRSAPRTVSSSARGIRPGSSPVPFRRMGATRSTSRAGSTQPGGRLFSVGRANARKFRVTCRIRAASFDAAVKAMKPATHAHVGGAAGPVCGRRVLPAEASFSEPSIPDMRLTEGPPSFKGHETPPELSNPWK